MPPLFLLFLLFLLTSRVCAGSFVVNVTQSSYQAEEKHSITLEWSFTTNTGLSLSSLNVLCQKLTLVKDIALLHVHEGVEVPESQDEDFAGRVQWDKDVLGEGRVRLQVSRLRTNDSGLYLCEVLTSYGSNSGECRLHVSAATDPEPERRRGTSLRKDLQPQSRGRIGLYGALPLAAALGFVCVGLFLLNVENPPKNMPVTLNLQSTGDAAASVSDSCS